MKGEGEGKSCLPVRSDGVQNSPTAQWARTKEKSISSITNVDKAGPPSRRMLHAGKSERRPVG